LGDIYCSLTYAISVRTPSRLHLTSCRSVAHTTEQNIELFFCLYANSWNGPEQCISSHSRVLGFLSVLPPIWRALQCIRRYYDTKNSFPHLVNCGKYTMTILAGVWLSLYRISDTHTNLSLFILFSTVNAIYCCEFCPPLALCKEG
jgi:hypothetical protein